MGFHYKTIITAIFAISLSFRYLVISLPGLNKSKWNLAFFSFALYLFSSAPWISLKPVILSFTRMILSAVAATFIRPFSNWIVALTSPTLSLYLSAFCSERKVAIVSHSLPSPVMAIGAGLIRWIGRQCTLYPIKYDQLKWCAWAMNQLAFYLDDVSFTGI